MAAADSSTSTTQDPSTAPSVSSGASSQGWKGGSNLQSNLRDAHERYSKVLQQVYEELQRPYTEAARSYLGVLQDNFGKPEGVRDLQKAQTEYFQRVSRPLSPDDGRELQGRMVEAYRDYLRDLQKALSQMDVSSLDPNGLASVGYVLSMAAYWLSAAQVSSGPVF